MLLTRIDDELCLDMEMLQRAVERLRLPDGIHRVALAVNNERRCFRIADIS